MIIQDRWYQSESVHSIIEFFNSLMPGQEGNPVVALPGGTGKSIVIARFIQWALTSFPNTQILALTHVKELIEQNAGKLVNIWFNAPIGIYSAGLNQKDVTHPIIFGGVQSVVKNKFLLERWFDLILIDEAHLLSPKEATSYIKIIIALKAINPNLRIVGFTATPYRMGQGMLTEPVEVDGKSIQLFTHIVYDMTDIDGWQRLIAEGFLCPLITPMRTDNNDAETKLIEFDVSEVGVMKGEFNQKELNEAVNQDHITRAALRQVVQMGQERWAWLIFAAGIPHADRIWRMLNNEFDIPTAIYHSERTKAENDAALKYAKNGDVRAIVNINSLTTGVDFPPWDLCAMMRPTLSTNMWVQMLSRFTRPYDFNKPGDVDPMAFRFIKQNALVLDFARNRKRLGPINDPKIPKAKGKGKGEVPVKICEVCDSYNHTRARFCEVCGHEFNFEVDISKTASTEDIMANQNAMPITEYFDVMTVIYNLHVPRANEKRFDPKPTVRVDYNCGIQRFTEYLCFEHPGLAKHRAHEWWRQRHACKNCLLSKTTTHTIPQCPPPATTAEVLKHMAEARTPKRIRVWMNKPGTTTPEVLSYEY
jgi:DNA repair protein RadD